jgi:septum formation protein
LNRKRKIILASGSPRRRELLQNLGLDFSVENSGFQEEPVERLNLEQQAEQLAAGKAKAAAANHPDAVIIAADTFGVIDGRVIGKPENAAQAREMLKMLSGKSHRVISGIAVIDTASQFIDTQAVATTVYFKELNNAEIDRYVATGEPLDKAGAYAVQGLGALLVERIEGDYYNVVGLPLFALAGMLKKIGISLL